MGELKVIVNKSQKLKKLYCNDKFYSSLVEKFSDYFEDRIKHITNIENCKDLEDTDPLAAVYLKSIVIEKDVPMLDELLDITDDENDWTLEYSGKLVSLKDTETGVKYSHVIVVCALFDIWTHELNFLTDSK